MNHLAPLTGWEPTAHSLHAAAQLLGAIRQLVREPVANYLELALRVERAGLATDTLPGGGRATLDFARAAMVYAGPGGDEHPIPLAGHSQAILFEALLRTMAEQGEALAPPRSGESLTQALLAALAARGHSFKPKAGELLDETPLTVDAAAAAAYGEVLYAVFTAVARFRARLDGVQTPIVVWPEHFDLSTLWFPTSARDDEAPVMSFGFSPFGGPGDRPYLYAYAYPMPDGFAAIPLPAPARWNTAPWKGLALDYDELLQAADPVGLIEATCATAYALLAPTLVGHLR